MPTAIEIMFAPEDEKQFLDFLSRFHLTAYPDRIPPDFDPIQVRADSQELFTEPGYYLAAEEMGPLEIHMIKKGKDKGWRIINEVNSAVIHYDRCVRDENNELRSGKLWTELNLNGDMQLNTDIFPEPYRRMWIQMREHVVSRSHKSNPAGYFIGHQAARLCRSGTVLREAGRKGVVIKPHR
jgi:hypothetical protein